jgi:hypothetical protein
MKKSKKVKALELLELKSSKPKPQLNDERREKAQTQK